MKAIALSEEKRNSDARRRDEKRDLTRHGQTTVIDVVCWHGELGQLALLLDCPWWDLAALVGKRSGPNSGRLIIAAEPNNYAWLRSKIHARIAAKGGRTDAL